MALVVQPLHVTTHKSWRKVLGLPPWTRLPYLYIHMRALLRLDARLAVLLLLTYMATSYSQN